MEFLNFILIFSAAYLMLRRPEKERLAFRTQTVAAAHALQGVERAAGLAVKGSEIFIVGEGGAVFVLDRPGA